MSASPNSKSSRSGTPIALVRDPERKPTDERISEITQVLAIGLGRLQLRGENLGIEVDDRPPVEPLWANALVAARAKRISR